MADLFKSFELKTSKLRNRIAVPPMCQYSAIDGVANDWHQAHYTSLARGGAGLVIVEATGVAPEGRITHACLGLWNDTQKNELTKIAKSIKAAGSVPGIQIGHAGRKASANRPWEKGGAHIDNNEQGGWQTISPSPIAFGGELTKVPTEMTVADIKRVQADFVSAAKRALDAGFEWLELHFAHGYLAQNFFSVHSNKRTDEYGGDAKGRGKFLRDTFAAVREVWPTHLPLAIRFGVIEFDGRDEQTLSESIDLIKDLKALGLDFVNVSMNFTTSETNIPWGTPAFMAPIAERVRKETGLPVASAWGIDTPELANNTVKNQQLDLVMIGKAHLADPHWPYKAAKELKVEKPSWTLPTPYAFWLERYTK